MKIAGPSSAPKTAPKSTRAIPRGRRSGGCMSAAAVLLSMTTPVVTPARTKPISTATREPAKTPNAVRSVPTIPIANPPASTGVRPKRSIVRPAGSAAMAAAAR